MIGLVGFFVVVCFWGVALVLFFFFPVAGMYCFGSECLLRC